MPVVKRINSLEDIVEQYGISVLDKLLCDKTTNQNIIWATDNYAELGEEYRSGKQIQSGLITGEHAGLILPRVEKSREEQESRTRNKAEVFTPSWVCNAQNNLVDRAWFGRNIIFNYEEGESWRTTKWSVEFSSRLQKTWQDYVKVPRLEITCGEAPYLVSRYDTVTGNKIRLRQRIGLLDRKLRVVHENNKEYYSWFYWVKQAFESVYGFEYQGDNLLLARTNLLLTFIDWVWWKAKRLPTQEEILIIVDIIVWNLWQMDGLKYVIPGSCHDVEEVTDQLDLFNTEPKIIPCPGCAKNDCFKHSGIYSKIMDWETGEEIRFVDMYGGKKA